MSCTKKIPVFDSLEEESDFWDTHSHLDFSEEFVEVEGPFIDARPMRHVLGIRLDAKTIDRLSAIGRKKGVGASTLARMWLLERLERER